MFHTFLIVILIFGLILCFLCFSKGIWKVDTANKEIIYHPDNLAKEVKKFLDELVNLNLSKLNVSQTEMEKRRRNRNNLRRAMRTCAYGDNNAKNHVKEYIKDILQRKLSINETTIGRAIAFDDMEHLTKQDLFDILLYIYQVKKEYGRDAIAMLIKDYGLDSADIVKEEIGYEISAEDIKDIFLTEIVPLRFVDKLEILTQRVFSIEKGNGVIDDLMEQKIDGVSGGVSAEPGDPEHLDSVWIMYRGKSIHLSCLSFSSEKELCRICKNIYKYNAPGQLSQATGFLVNSLKNGSRVSDMRPPFASSWAFWIRMFDSVEKQSIVTLYPQKGKECLLELLKLIIKGEQTSVISGQQESGKTTCLEALVEFINPAYNIRTIELTFELRLARVYPKRNIAAMRETSLVSTEQAIEFVKKTDADVVLFGEIAKETEGEKVIKLSQSGSRFSLSTHHGTTTKSLVNWFRNALIHSSGFRNESIAQQQVVEAIRFDIHLMKKPNGERFVERITEIIPKEDQSLVNYEAVNLLEYQDGHYKRVHPISPQTRTLMEWNLGEKDRACLKKEEEIFVIS